MQTKKSFILYNDLISVIEILPDDKAGQLFKIILNYVNNKPLVIDDLLMRIAFGPIKNQLERDGGKWADTCSKRAEAGRLGGIKSGEVRSKLKQKEANKADNVNDTVTVNVTDNVIVTDNVNENVNESENIIQLPPPSSSISFDNFWNLYNKKVGLVNCKTLFNELTEDEKLQIEQRLPVYIKATENEVMYRKDPYTWLMGKHWLDEHVPPTIKKSAFEMLCETGRYE